jgi:predicted nucleotide-binding protein (sugar kinase/HSP70/actin superfamily)
MRKPSLHISTEDVIEFFQELDGSISKSKLNKFLDKTLDSAEFVNKIQNVSGQTLLHVLASKVRKK